LELLFISAEKDEKFVNHPSHALLLALCLLIQNLIAFSIYT
jgi:ACR3 family arsenite efflux pump ArsB